MHYYHLILILFERFVIFFCNDIAKDTKCIKQSDCVEQGVPRCSICVDKLPEKIRHCIFPFKYMYLPISTCGNRIDCENKCLNGYCPHYDEPTFIPYCYCYPNHYGKYCQHYSNSPAIVGFNVNYLGIITVGQEKEVTFRSRSHTGSLHDKTEVYIKIGEESFQKVNYISKFSYLAAGRYQTIVAEYVVTVLFPYLSINSGLFYTLGNEIIGYKSKCAVTVYIDKKIIFENSWDYIVSYETKNLICVPMILVTNCATNHKDSTQYVRSSSIEIKSYTSYIRDGRYLSSSVIDANCKDDAATTVVWKLWKLGKEGKALSDVPLYENYTNNIINLFPFSLHIGEYKSSFQLTKVSTSGTFKDIKECFLKVKCEPLVPVIVGGSDRQIFKKLGLLLRAEKSHDPNMPANQRSHLYVEWKCVNILHPEKSDDMCAPKQFKVSKPYYIPPEYLTSSAVYNFTLKLWTNRYNHLPDCENVSPQYAYVRIQVANDTEIEINSVTIVCVQNCKDKVAPNQELFLRVKLDQNHIQSIHTDFKWTYYKNDESEKTTDPFRVEGLPTYMLLMKENSFNKGSKYTIVVRVGSTGWYAKYSFETDIIDYSGNCSTNPTNGTKGLTRFDIVCTMYANSTFIFEFYDKNAEEAKGNLMFTGRMLGTSNTGQLLDVALTRGNVIVYVLNKYGFFLGKEIFVELSDWEIDSEIMSGIYSNITKEIQRGTLPRVLRYISIVPDIIPSSMNKNKSDILNALLTFINKLPVTSLAEGKLCTSTLTNVLLTLNKPSQLELKTDLMMFTLNVIKAQAEMFSKSLKTSEAENMSPIEARQITVCVLNCLYAALLSRDKKTVGVNEDDLDYTLLNHLKRGSIFAEQTLDSLKNILSYSQVPGHPPTKVSAMENSFVTWVMEQEEGMSIPQLLNMDKDIPIEFTDALQDSLMSRLNKDEEIALQVIIMNQNIFWWCKSDVKSQLVSVSLNRQYHMNMLYPIHNIQIPMNVIVNLQNNLTSTIISNSIIQLDPIIGEENLDLQMRIHRLDPPPRSLVSLKFMFPQTNASLRVVVMHQFRPDYQIMKTKSTIVNEKSPVFTLMYYETGEPYFLFIGIIPGPEVDINKTVVYSFEVNTTLCQLWVKGQWSSSGCHIKNVNHTEVNCECNHFSIFSAAFPVPPEEIDLFSDAKLFLTVLENPIVVSFVTSVLLIYLLLCLWLCRQDKKSKNMRSVIIINDSFPSDPIPYLIAVYTSSRCSAGTTAHVGIKLCGRQNNSRAHILSSMNRKVLQKNCDDWFLIYCPQPLGEIESIHLWHDNTGPSPDWFCEKIHVYDLNEQIESLFVIKQWLALRLNEYPEVHVLSADTQDLMNVKRLFLDNCVLGLRENHIFLSCVFSHPRSGISKFQRISIFMCCIMVAMLCSIMFYIPSGAKSNTDDFQYSVGTREIYVSIQTLIISVIVTYLVLFAFKRSFKYTYASKKSILHLRNEVSLSSFQDNTPKSHKNRSLYQSFVQIITRSLKSHPMQPVQLPIYRSVVKVQKIWYILAWVSSITVIVGCSYLVMLYGLKLGLIRSKEWLSSLLLTIGSEIFIFAPVRIMFMSSLLALAFQNMFDLSTHQIGINEVKLVKIPDDEEYMYELIRTRSHPMYAPLQYDCREKMIKKRELRNSWWDFIDFINSIGLVVVLSSIIFKLWSSYYYTNNHVKTLMTTSHKFNNEAVDFSDIRIVSDLERYMDITFIHVMFNLRWYNGWPLRTINTNENNYWASDFAYSMLGLSMIRQLRVIPFYCRNIVLKGGKCIPHWSSSSGDTDDYGERWKPASWSDRMKYNSPWKYTEKSTKFMFTLNRMYGGSGILYNTGGYLTLLGPSKKDVELKLAELRENFWQNVQTRVVIVDLTLYNVNEDLFTQVTLIIEYLISGTIVLQAHTISVEARQKLTIWGILFILFILYYLLRCASLINRQGFMQYLSGFSNVCRLIILLLSLLCIVILGAHYYKSSRYLESFLRSGIDNYFDFDSFRFFFTILQMLLSVLIFFAILHMIILLRGGRIIITYYYMFVLSLSWIFWLTAVITFLIVAMVHITSLFVRTMSFRVKEFIINKNSLQNLAHEDFEYILLRAFVVIKTVSVSMLVSFFVILFMYYLKLARSYRMQSSDSFNFVLFLVSQLKRSNKDIKTV